MRVGECGVRVGVEGCVGLRGCKDVDSGEKGDDSEDANQGCSLRFHTCLSLNGTSKIEPRDGKGETPVRLRGSPRVVGAIVPPRSAEENRKADSKKQVSGMLRAGPPLRGCFASRATSLSG